MWAANTAAMRRLHALKRCHGTCIELHINCSYQLGDQQPTQLKGPDSMRSALDLSNTGVQCLHCCSCQWSASVTAVHLPARWILPACVHATTAFC
jgi:hypothetical protein